MTAEEILRGTKTVLGRGWCQGAYARNAAGEPVSTFDPTAVSWSLVGAMSVAWGAEKDMQTIPQGKERVAIYAPFWAARRLMIDAQPDVFATHDDPGRTVGDLLAVLDAALSLELAT